MTRLRAARLGRRHRRGMTLMEVMIALVIIVMMSVMVAQSLSNSIEFNNLLSQQDGTTRSARVALSKIRRDLQLAYLTPNRQIVDRYQTVFVGMDEGPDKVFFASLGPERIYMNSRECDQTEITVWAENAPDEQGKGYILYHREAPRIDHEPDLEGTVYPLAYNVRSFDLRYLDAVTNEWEDEWDTRSSETPYRLPRAVQIALVLIGEDPAEPDRSVDIPFLSNVVLQYGPPILGPNSPQLLTGGAGYGVQGGFGGAGAGGLGATGGLGGALGAMKGAQKRPTSARGRGGNNSASRPASSSASPRPPTPGRAGGGRPR